MSGMNIRRNNQRTTIGVAHVTNMTNDPTIGGGRGVIFEDGVTSGDSKLSVCETLICTNGFNAFTFNGGTGTGVGDKSDNTNVLNNLLCENIEVPIGLFGNNTGYPHDGQAMSLVINSFIGRNCGKIVTAATPAVLGLISSDRASNVSINSMYLFNDAAYLVGAEIRLWAGHYNNCHVRNAVIDSDLKFIVTDGASFSSQDSTFDVTVSGDISTDLFTSALSAATNLVNNIYDFKINTIATDRLVPANINLLTSNTLTVHSKEHNCTVKGHTGTGGISAGFTVSNFAGFIGTLGTVLMSDGNGQPHLLSVSTAGKLLIDGTIVGTQV
jgi:hypothetical protein